MSDNPSTVKAIRKASLEGREALAEMVHGLSINQIVDAIFALSRPDSQYWPVHGADDISLIDSTSLVGDPSEEPEGLHYDPLEMDSCCYPVSGRPKDASHDSLGSPGLMLAFCSSCEGEKGAEGVSGDEGICRDCGGIGHNLPYGSMQRLESVLPWTWDGYLRASGFTYDRGMETLRDEGVEVSSRWNSEPSEDIEKVAWSLPQAHYLTHVDPRDHKHWASCVHNTIMGISIYLGVTPAEAAKGLLELPQ